jgi:hypothetical protein
MKTTLNLDDSVMRRLKREAQRQGRTMSDLVETALRLFLRRPKEAHDLPPLPTFSGGRPLVDVADREALYRAMEGR